jgi:hypothetical protein
MGQSEIMHPRSASLALATARIAETDLSETGGRRLDVAGFGVSSSSSCSPLKGSSSPSAAIRFVKTVVSTKVSNSGISTTVKHTTL